MLGLDRSVEDFEVSLLFNPALDPFDGSSLGFEAAAAAVTVFSLGIGRTWLKLPQLERASV